MTKVIWKAAQSQHDRPSGLGVGFIEGGQIRKMCRAPVMQVSLVRLYQG